MSESKGKETRLRLNTTGTERSHDRFGRVISERAGVIIRQLSMVKTHDRGIVTFTTPSASALSLQEAIDAAETADDLRQQLTWITVPSPHGTAQHIDDGQLTELFDCLQKSMVCVSFSFLALEVFVNEKISEQPNRPVTVEVSGRDGKVKTTKHAKYWEKRLSTEVKLGVVLPQLMEVVTPKGRQEWEGFRMLQRTRNDIIHLKAETSNPRVIKNSQIPGPSVFYRFVTQDAMQYPSTAVSMILYFAAQSYIPDWLPEPMQRLGIKLPETPKK